ncbi:hypothetical protein [Undibacterium sp.]|uniref:hypothetical protein n=1 Tax=Undibacterium sp. TaxID=1914977 RepID=UPI0037535595
MNHCPLKYVYSIVISLSFLSFTSFCLANTVEKAELLPANWTILAKEKSTKDGVVAIEGYFSNRTVKTKAMLVENKIDGSYGLAVTMRPHQLAIIIKTFKDIVANPPSLSVVKSGKYHPSCTPEVKNCDAFFVKNQAIGLFFDESSGQVIYFDNNKFNTAYVTD